LWAFDGHRSTYRVWHCTAISPSAALSAPSALALDRLAAEKEVFEVA
jgi:hypothetical protein